MWRRGGGSSDAGRALAFYLHHFHLYTLNVKIQCFATQVKDCTELCVSERKKSLDFRKVATLPIPGIQNLYSAVLCMVISELEREGTPK